MTKTVKRKIAKSGNKPRTRRVKQNKTEKIEVRVELAFFEKWCAACEKKGMVRSHVVRKLAEAFIAAVDAKKNLDGPWELRGED